MKVKDVNAVGAKWSTRAGAAGQAYTDGVKNPKTPWMAATTAADKNWAAGVQAAVSDGRFDKGVARAGDSGWQQGALNKGATRYGPGVSLGQPKYIAGVTKFFQALSNFTLPPKFPKGDPQNYQRSTAVGTLLRNVKLGKA